jgi:DNA polymerase-3 subunit alpha
MAFVTLEDLSGSMEALIFPKTLMEANQVVKENAVVIVRGRISAKEEEEPKLVADEVKSVEDANPERVRAQQKAQNGAREGLYIRVPSKESEAFRQACNLFSIFEGNWPVYVRFDDTGKMERAPQNMWTLHNQTLLAELGALLGAENVAIR